MFKISRGPRPDAELRDCDVGPEMVVVPAGSFPMGSSPDEARQVNDKGLVRRMMIPKPLAVEKYEAMFAGWNIRGASDDSGDCRLGGEGWACASIRRLASGWLCADGRWSQRAARVRSAAPLTRRNGGVEISGANAVPPRHGQRALATQPAVSDGQCLSVLGASRPKGRSERSAPSFLIAHRIDRRLLVCRRSACLGTQSAARRVRRNRWFLLQDHDEILENL